MNGRIRKCNWRNYLWSLSEFNITNIMFWNQKYSIFCLQCCVSMKWWLSDPLLIIVIIWTPKTHNFTQPQLKPSWTTSKTLWAKITQPLPYWVRSGESFIIYDVQAVPFLLWVKSGVYRNIGILERILRLAIRFDMGSYQVIQRP